MDGNGCSIGTHFLSYKPKKMPGKTVAAKILGNWSMLRNNVAAIVENIDV